MKTEITVVVDMPEGGAVISELCYGRAATAYQEKR